jgi:hypothetical protein
MTKTPSTTGQKIEQAFEKALDPFAASLKRATRPAEAAAAPAATPAGKPGLAVSPLAVPFPTIPPIGGVEIATARAGFYKHERDDLVVFRFARGTSCAGVFTRHKIGSAPVDWCKKHLGGAEGGKDVRALVVNAGCKAADIAHLAAARPGGSSAEVRENLHLLYVRGPSSPLGEAALTGLVALARERWPKGSRGEFLAAIAPAAVRSAQQFHIPPSVSLGQAALESAWGRSKLSREHNNLFGIKGGGAKNSVRYFPNNGNTRKRTSYRTYGSWEASVAHHAELLGTHRAYAKARPLWTEWEAYLAAVAPKYASNRRYAKEVAWFIERYDLDQWDAMVVEASGADAVADAAMPSDE